MADYENFTEINENFDTIKTLLNSIRAQGILNTSDVDKLLTGINTKLEKINTEEDIDLIKIFLSELKQNLDERHSILVSKFAAIESLFTNLLKNSSEMPKSSDIKELFDIVATNLSVFSREVVSQKESLTDITLRLDAMRSDDSQKKDIIKNIAILKSDLERLSNGFDSIVINLNDNFKTLIKTITSLDKTDYFEKFSDNLSSIEMSSNTVLSALQMLDKKTEQVENNLKDLATKDDLNLTSKKLFELSANSQELTAAVTDLAERYVRVDNLADKIDASVNIIATLKTTLEANENNHTQQLVEKLNFLQDEISKILTNSDFENFKLALETTLKEISQTSFESSKNSYISIEEFKKLSDLINGLEIQVNFQDLASKISKSEADLKQYVLETEQRISTLNDANITRVLNDITTNADSLGNKLNQTQTALAVLCEKNFGSVFENITDLKKLLAQLDENSISANNAIFSSITDRLTAFEEGFRASLESQEKSVAYSSAQVIEQVDNIKNISSILDYKIDSSVVEIGNVKREFSSLQTAVEKVLALDFVNAVKDLRIDLYASKQELATTVENSDAELVEKFSNDLYGKYELLISKLDSVEEEIKKAQASSLSEVKDILEKISASIVDVLSYVSEAQTGSFSTFETKLASISDSVKEHSMNYVESVRDIVDVIRIQVENNLKNIEEFSIDKFDTIKKAVSENSEDIKKDIKYSYSKLLEIQDSYSELTELLNVNNVNSDNKLNLIIASANDIKTDFDAKLLNLKTTLLDKVLDFKQEISSENTDNISDFKSSVENLYNKNNQAIADIILETKNYFTKISEDSSITRADNLAKIIENIDIISSLIKELAKNSDSKLNSSISELSENLSKVQNSIIDTVNSTANLINQKADSISGNFSSTKMLVTDLHEKSAENLDKKIASIMEEFSSMKTILAKVDENVDGDMTRQLSIIESNFESLVSQITIIFDKFDLSLSDKINQEFSDMSETMQEIVSNKLDSYRVKIEETFNSLEEKNLAQSEYIQERIANLNSALKSIWEEQSEGNIKHLEEIADNLKNIINENIEATTADYDALRTDLSEFVSKIESNNKNIAENFRTYVDNITEKVSNSIELQGQESINIISNIENSINKFNTNLEESSLKQENTLGTYVDNILEQIEFEKQTIKTAKDYMADLIKQEVLTIISNVEKETDVIVKEIIEQFDLLKSAQNDDLINLTDKIEEIINSQIYNNVEDLKSYLDFKTDNSILLNKLDNLKIELSNSISSLISDLNKLLDAGLFTSAMAEFKLANEVLVNSAIDKLNDKIEDFISENNSTLAEAITSSGEDLKEKLELFDKNLAKTIVDKYEEIKQLSNEHNTSLLNLESTISDVFTNFEDLKNNIEEKVNSLKTTIEVNTENSIKEILLLKESFDNLRSQISSKSFDEAFQASINKQIGSLEELISEQLGYIRDLGDLCATTLPDITEMNTLVKHSILESIDDLTTKLENQDIEGIVEKELKQAKSEIITQLLNVFNQVSFVAEQEEILDFIQDKHDELITILSHIVTTSDELSQVKDSVSQLNEKINAIISSNGDIDYIYSLHDLETDIANLRIALKEIKESDRGEEFTNLVNSTEEIYKLVESVKNELPNKSDFETLSEDIVSISTRTNKLLLSSDESYKALQDNLQEFKLVINDLDERTRNFAQDSGMDKLDAKLNAINNMMLNGAKTNQVFNQVFEYLAEWVDNASVQINNISDKVESLDNIEQIKTMLNDMKAQDNTESMELVEALSTVFDKQVKRISSLEKKLDKIIVETTITNSKNDLTSMEETLNKFLVAMEDKLSSQQDKINSLEAKLENVLGNIDNKDTAQLSKKVGGMDKQIAKLNKNIEKIASHVIEK